MRVRGLIGVVALAAALTACGGSGSSSGQPAPPTTPDVTAPARMSAARKAFVAKADEICAASNRAIVAKTPQQQPSGTALERFVQGVVVPSRRTMLRKLRALTPPPGDAAQVGAVLDAISASVDQLGSDPTAVTAAQPSAEATRAYSLAKEYGFTTCGVT